MLNWFRRNRTSPAADPQDPVDSGGVEAGREPWPAGGLDPPHPAVPPAMTASGLWDVISRRTQDVLASIPGPPGRSDAHAVIASFAEGLDTAIGQPPFAAQRALAVSRNPHSSVDDLARLFASDPGLAQALLSHANSSFYARVGEHCASLASAVQRIGSSGVESVLLANTVRGVLCRPGGNYSRLVDQVWFHMVRTGPIARLIAPAFQVESERAFSMALLHDAGKLVMFEQVSNYRKNHRREVSLPQPVLLQALRELHEPIGGLAALRWGLEDRSARAITTHHRDPVPGYPDPLSEVLHLAEKLDLAAVNARPLDLEAAWETGELTGDLAMVRSLLDQGLREAA